MTDQTQLARDAEDLTNVLQEVDRHRAEYYRTGKWSAEAAEFIRKNEWRIKRSQGANVVPFRRREP